MSFFAPWKYEYSIIYKVLSAVHHEHYPPKPEIQARVRESEKNGGMIMFEDYPEIMTIAQVSQALRIGRNSAYMLVNNNLLGHLRIGSTIRVPKACLLKYVDSSWSAVEKQ